MGIEADRYIKNPKLETIKQDWKGNPITAKNRFLNHEFPFIPRASEILKWKLKGENNNKAKREDKFRLKTSYPSEYFETNQDGIIWLGHASFLIRIDGIKILIDPVLSSPFFTMKRFVEFPFDPEIIKGLDYILLSHDHRDHLDKKSLKLICKNNNEAKILTGLNMQPLVSSWVDNEIQEAGWYQKFDTEQLDFCFLPTRHWSKRGLIDTNQRLWGSFMIQGKKRNIYFGGDSGYGSHYKELGMLFPQIDYAILGIGAYKPEWFMHPSHCSPQDAYKAAVDAKAKNLLPMHYGAFDLSDESIGEPIKELIRAHKEKNDPIDLINHHPGMFVDI